MRAGTLLATVRAVNVVGRHRLPALRTPSLTNVVSASASVPSLIRVPRPAVVVVLARPFDCESLPAWLAALERYADVDVLCGFCRGSRARCDRCRARSRSSRDELSVDHVRPTRSAAVSDAPSLLEVRAEARPASPRSSARRVRRASDEVIVRAERDLRHGRSDTTYHPSYTIILPFPSV